MISKKVINIIKKSPDKPGVYYFLRGRKVIYVGKAIKLKSRLSSYLDEKVLNIYVKTRELVLSCDDVKYILCNNEVEALVLESNLIKKYQPKYNINLKDDKYFKYIKIEKQKDASYKISIVRKNDKTGKCYGPFVEGKSVKMVLNTIRKLLPFRDCNNSKFNYYKSKKTPCMYGHIGLCMSPCQSSLAVMLNNRNVNKIKKFLNGDYKKVVREIEKEMIQYSKKEEYEKALKVKEKIDSYKKLSENYLNEVELMQNIGNLEDTSQNVVSLFELLSGYFPLIKNKLKENDKNYLIEFFDVSNLGDKYIVGAHISLLNGNYYRKGYRKYKIRTQKTQNDFYSIREVVDRRLKNLEKWGRPDLIVLDGGKGQLSVCHKMLEEVEIPVITLAKQDEAIYLRFKEKFYKINLSRFSKALMVLVKGRNEVHRFVLSYNRKLRLRVRKKH